jgi:hypothetical protein
MGTWARFRGFRAGINWRPCPEFWNDAPDQPRHSSALFGASGTFHLEGYWNDLTGDLHDVSQTIQFESSDPHPVQVQLKSNPR